MILKMVTIDDLKRSLRLLDDDIDSGQEQQLELYLNSAKAYINNAVGADESFYESPDYKDIYKTAVLALATAYYQNPSGLSTGNISRVDLVLNSILIQLRLGYLSEKRKIDGTTK